MRALDRSEKFHGTVPPSEDMSEQGDGVGLVGLETIDCGQVEIKDVFEVGLETGSEA